MVSGWGSDRKYGRMVKLRTVVERPAVKCLPQPILAEMYIPLTTSNPGRVPPTQERRPHALRSMLQGLSYSLPHLPTYGVVRICTLLSRGCYVPNQAWGQYVTRFISGYIPAKGNTVRSPRFQLFRPPCFFSWGSTYDRWDIRKVVAGP